MQKDNTLKQHELLSDSHRPFLTDNELRNIKDLTVLKSHYVHLTKSYINLNKSHHYLKRETIDLNKELVSLMKELELEGFDRKLKLFTASLERKPS
jgi:hypothetical protein